MMNEEAKKNLVKENMGKIREKMEKVARENAIKDLKELQIDIGSSPDDLEQSPLYYALDIAIKALEQQPNSLEQIKWERDTAINQLKELGYGFGERIEKCEDCISRQAVLDKKELVELNDGQSFYCINPKDVETLPSVTPQQTRWIPVRERLPKELEPVNITWINHNPINYYANIKDKPFTATGVYFNGQWYWWSVTCTDILAEYSHSFDDIIDDAIEVIAWQPLPQSYKADKEV